MAQPSPYTPGIVASEVPGRDRQLSFYSERAQFIGALGRFAGRITVHQAARGVGKTSLLRKAQSKFEAAGIDTVWITANSDDKLIEVLRLELANKLPKSEQVKRNTKNGIENVTVGVGTSGTGVRASLKPNSSSSLTSLLKSDIKNTALHSANNGKHGIVILVDELQSADPVSLRAIAHAWQELVSEEHPPAAGFFAAGLPGTQELVVKAVTFSERFAFVPLPNLDDAGVADALLSAAQRQGVSWEKSALNLAVDNSGGYPYKVQLIGDETWQEAGYPDSGYTITQADVENALPETERQMYTLFAARWRSASRKQREIITAIAELGGENVRRSDIATHLGVSSNSISVPRDKLIASGIIESTGHGEVSFTVPGFTEYVLRERD